MSRLYPRSLLARSCAGIAAGLVLAGQLVVATPVRAADDDDNAPDVQILRGIMKSLGLRSGDEADINYEPRPPLVLPPSTTLPPPESAGATPSNPAWPKDPDVTRAKRLKKEAANALPGAEQVDLESRPLSPEQMTPGAKNAPRGRRRSANVDNPSVGSSGSDILSPSELGYRGGLFGLFSKDDEKAAGFTGEPPRTSLTEPPRGYQTPSPDQPYGVGQSKAAPNTRGDAVTRSEQHSDR